MSRVPYDTAQDSSVFPSVAVYSAYYPSHGGGIELTTDELVRRLCQRGFGVTWLAQSTGKLPQGLESVCKPVAGLDAIYNMSGVPLPIPSPSAVPAIAATMLKSDIAIIIEANFVISMIAFAIAKLLNHPVVVVQHVGVPSTVSKWPKLLMRLGEWTATRSMLRHADGVVCVSDKVARHFKDLQLPQGMEVIGHGIDTDLFRLPASSKEKLEERRALDLCRAGKWACFVGRLTESKGISVIRELAKLRPDWNFAIAGTGPISPLQWGYENVFPLGFLDRKRVAQLYRACDVMVLPSPSESFSLVIREALASGCGVLCSEQILEVDPGLEDFVAVHSVDLKDLDSTAKRISDGLNSLSHNAQAARNYVEATCSWDVVLSRYIDIIQYVSKRGNRSKNR